MMTTQQPAPLTPPRSRHGVRALAYRWVMQPIVSLLRVGMEPRQLAWSLALGAVIGINPLLGSTTLLALAMASLFRLNIVASQVGNHIMYPLELLLFPVFVKLGSMVFATERLPLHGHELWVAARQHPLDTTRVLWRWEWHALVVWAVFAVVAMPTLALLLEPALRRLSQKLPKRQPASSTI